MEPPSKKEVMGKNVTQITSMLNSFNFDQKAFNNAMSYEHKTLQQSFTRLCVKWIQYCASDEYGKNVDGRNENSHQLCREIMAACEEKNIFFGLPLV